MKVATSSRLKLERKPSIETEPLTLTLDQLRHARESAVYILSSKTPEEALNIFTEGVKPVVSCTSIRMDFFYDDDDDDDDNDDLEIENFDNIMLKKDMVTAPF